MKWQHKLLFVIQATFSCTNAW